MLCSRIGVDDDIPGKSHTGGTREDVGFVSLLSVAIALSSITVIGKDLAVWESDPYHQRVSALLPGFFVWIASLALVPLACWLKMKGSKQETTLKSD
jgi:hypothetical protein